MSRRTTDAFTYHEVSTTNSVPWTVQIADFFGGRSGRTKPLSVSVALTAYRYRSSTASSGRFQPRVCVAMYGASERSFRIVDESVSQPTTSAGGTPALIGMTTRTIDSGASYTDSGSASVTLTVDVVALGGQIPTEIAVWVEDGSVDPEVLASESRDPILPPYNTLPTPVTATAQAQTLYQSIHAALSASPPADTSRYNALPCRVNLPIYRRTTDTAPFFQTDLSRKIDLWFIGPEAATGDRFPDIDFPQQDPNPWGGLATGGEAYVAFYGGAGLSAIADAHVKGAAFASFVHLTTSNGQPDPQRRTGTVRFDYIVGDEVTTDSTHVFPPAFVSKRSVFTIHKIWALPRTHTFETVPPFVPPLALATGHEHETPIGEGVLIPLNVSAYRTLTGTLQITLET